MYPILEQEIIHFSTKGNCIACGDFNGYTSTESDFIETDDFRYLPLPLNYSVDTYIARNNCDTRIPNGFGNKLLDLCKNTRLRIANGRFFGDTTGKFTCYHYMNAPSVIDYMLVSQDLLKFVCNFCVEPLNPLSIHCMIRINLKFTYNRYDEGTNTINLQSLPTKFHFDKLTEEKFYNYMMTGKGADDVETYVQSTFDNNISGINEATDSLTEIILNAARNVCRPKYITKKRKKNRWYNISCITAYRSARKVSRMLF